ncbi:MAG: DNA-processing protein DprA [Desulfotomaculaceae bacterium]|nr:DNA-processing protein DprA [Desulfotomaculaceae bacterium]MDD4766028.1 DNA-processing protein DprA [Desulfotomaculaceae bacterium]
MEDRLYWLGWQCLMPERGKKLWSLLKHFGSPRAAWKASVKELTGVPGIGANDPEDLARRRAEFDPAKEAARLQGAGVSFICYGEPDYPENLLQIFDPPPVIFIKGSVKSSDKLAVAVVGSRKPSPYGLLVAERFTKDLAALGVTVVSGMARGIDTAGHKGALVSGGRTVAVLGCGLDVVYPRENKKLMDKIVDSGAVISEYPLGTPPESWHFPARNRIISGLSLGTVVIEAAEKSGALITADFALEQGRDVMAVPGNIVSPLSRGPHRLIKQGARLVQGAGDIIDELGLERLFPAQEENDGGKVKMSVDEEALYSLLSLEPVSLDELIDKTGFPPQKVLAALMYLEIKGFTRQMPGKLYVRAGWSSF